MKNLNLCAVVVWFNPQSLEKPVSNVNSYSKFLHKVYIVDNSECDNSNIAKEIQNAVYIPLKKNTGIANALNVGCELAIKDGFEFCMTMDQDSVWEETELKKYIEKISENKNEFQNFSPVLKYSSLYSFTENLKHLLFHSKQKEFFDFQFSDRWITSGSVLNLNVWEELGKFNTELFIDEVDFDYCARFSERGFKNLCLSDVILNHNLGAQKKVLFINYGAHSDFRLYYQIRNLLYMCRVYPAYTYKYKYKYKCKLIKLTLKIILLHPLKIVSYLRLYKKAVLDSKKIFAFEAEKK